VAGSAADNPHRRQGRRADDEGLVKISVDYGFISTGAEAEPKRTLMVIHASRSKAIMTRIVKRKGRGDPSSMGWYEPS
jgi:hypothetical protein